MAPSPSTHRRPFNTRGRGRGRPRGRPSSSSASNPTLSNGISATPLDKPKKRRYIPGGPGGGGRYVDEDGNETPVGGTGPGGYAYTGPRGRAGRDHTANGLTPARVRSRRREKLVTRPRYSSAAAAAAAVQGDGYKPREERGWEEFHPQLEIEATLMVFSADEVDGVTPTNTNLNGESATSADDVYRRRTSTNGINGGGTPNGDTNRLSPTPATNGANNRALTPPANSELALLSSADSPFKRRPGRPPRRPESIFGTSSTSPGLKVIPPPGPNPNERLTLPKPSFRATDSFSLYEQKAAGQQRYVDRTMSNVGYQESDEYIRPERRLIRVSEGAIEEDLDLGPSAASDGETNKALGGGGVGRVEYDMDEQDDKWLAAYNGHRKTLDVEAITREIFEITMTKIEKEWHALEKRIPKPNPKPPQTHRPRSSSAAAVNGEIAGGGTGEEQDSKCAICDDGDCENTNAIVFCDGCDLAVHQECYGVPFIPEGQWLCRKCQLIGRGTPTCIFCPNTDGAFKQTNSSRWSHLLCAIWIPEVTLGNTIFMEPVMDVEKVPKQRWKLTCYICRQKMGACVQCGNKNCFIAFHVTCARRARLFLKMKSAHGGPANLDSAALKAYCDKHVPPEWRRENDVDAAIVDAQDFYHHTMRGRLWADSQQSALAPQRHMMADHGDDATHQTGPRISLSLGGNKRKRAQPPKTVWKLPSGAPVIPQVVYNSVESSLQRFTIRKRKEYAAEACKYWTLKREARRGAALLKRLQLQMETFSSMEITRRNFAGMGAAGRLKLQRRIEFALRLRQDVERLRLLCDEVKKREREKLKEVEILKDVVDIVYFPIAPLLWPIMEKAQALDGKGLFREGFGKLRAKLDDRYYTSVKKFSTDLLAVFSSVTGLNPAEVVANREYQTNGSLPAKAVPADQKEGRKIAGRVSRAVKPLLAEARRKELELEGKPYEKEVQELDSLWNNSLPLRRNSMAASLCEDGSEDGMAMRDISANSVAELEREKMVDDIKDIEMEDVILGAEIDVHDEDAPGEEVDDDTYFLTLPANDSIDIENANGRPIKEDIQLAGGQNNMLNQLLPKDEFENGICGLGTTARENRLEREDKYAIGGRTENREHGPSIPQPTPPTSPSSSEDEATAPLAHGGIPWYMQPFDPIGTVIHEERWTGREVLRGMSEELSEIDDDELRGLVDNDPDGYGQDIDGNIQANVVDTTATPSRKKASKRAKGGKRSRSYR
ncbi:MAG: nuA3 HAT complex component nto1 [Geoglossum umbratile]|nr:MAG: nuA3 HAT complex component nto1 [Geoglossum umbratile]